MIFLINEADLILKGSNAVVSYLYYFFENVGLGEYNIAELHCDNYPGQNKNRHETMAERPCDNYPGQNKEPP